MRRYTDKRYGVPWARTTVRIMGEKQIETFEAMCWLAGRKPHEMAADVILDAIREGQHDHETQALVTSLKRTRRNLRAIP